MRGERRDRAPTSWRSWSAPTRRTPASSRAVRARPPSRRSSRRGWRRSGSRSTCGTRRRGGRTSSAGCAAPAAAGRSCSAATPTSSAPRPRRSCRSVRDGRMHGRGTCDMKAGIAAAVAAAESAGRRSAGGRRAARLGDRRGVAERRRRGADRAVSRRCGRPAGADRPRRRLRPRRVRLVRRHEPRARGRRRPPELGRDAIALAGPLLDGIAALDRDLAAARDGAVGPPERARLDHPRRPELPQLSDRMRGRRRALPDAGRVGGRFAGRDAAAARRGRGRRTRASTATADRGRARAGAARSRGAGGAGDGRGGRGRARPRARRAQRLRLDGLGYPGRGRHPVRRPRAGRRRAAHRRRVGRPASRSRRASTCTSA